MIDKKKKLFACELELFAKASLKSESVIVTTAIHKDSKQVGVKASEMVFQGRHSQCEEAIDYRRWALSKTELSNGSIASCELLGEKYKRKTCVVVGALHSPWNLLSLINRKTASNLRLF